MAKELTDSGYLLTPAERASHFKVYAGPGAGKTHFLANNTGNIIETDPVMTGSLKRKVLCITYTNSAAGELKERLGRSFDRVVISTIHSFIGEHIIKPYQPMLKKLINERYGIEVPAKTRLHSQIEGRGLLFGFHRDDLYNFIRSRSGGTEEIEYSRAAVESVVLRTVDYEIGSSKKIAPQHVKLVKEFLWSVAGVLSHDEVLIFGLELARRFSLVIYSLRTHFPYVFIDEFQDTNPLQTALVQLICSSASAAGVIGDAAQSIYSFQDAKPEDFISFSVPEDKTRGVNEYVLKTNRRSKDNIVKILNYFRQKDPSLSDQLTLKNPEDPGRVTFFVEKVDPTARAVIPAAIQAFIDDGAYVLTRTWAQTFQYIRGIDPSQVEIVNALNNTYTYQLNRDFRKTVSEFRDVPWVRALVRLTSLESALTRGCLPSALRSLGGLVDPKAVYSDPALLREFVACWKEIVGVLREEKSLIENFTKVNSVFSRGTSFWGDSALIENSSLIPDDPGKVDKKIHELLSELHYRTGRTLVTEVFSDQSKYMTVHQAKGREFEKVLAYLEPARMDGKASYLDTLAHPDTTYSSEYARIVYVAMSRAISHLGVHIKTLQDISVLARSIDEWSSQKGISRQIYEVVVV